MEKNRDQKANSRERNSSLSAYNYCGFLPSSPTRFLPRATSVAKTIMDFTVKQVIFTVFYSAISLLAIAGNGIVIYLVVNFRQMRSVTNFFILNLALGDLLMVVLCIPFTFTSSYLLYNWPFGEALCRLVSYSQAVSVFVSAYTLVAISIDRYIAIISPLRPRMTKAHSYQIIFLIWFFSLLTPVPIAVLSKTVFMSSDPSQSSNNQSASNAINDHHSVNKSLSTSASSSSSPSSPSSSLLPASQSIPSSLSSSPLSVSSDSLSASPSSSSSSLVSSSISSLNVTCQCIEDWTWPGEDYRAIYSLMLMTLQYVIPFTILVFTYTRIGLVVWGKQTPGEAYGQRDAKMAASKRKVSFLFSIFRLLGNFFSHSLSLKRMLRIFRFVSVIIFFTYGCHFLISYISFSRL